MSLYNDVIGELKKENDVNELYRFQGGNSSHIINVRRIKTHDKDGYVYFSGSRDHHKYFMIKRIRQLLNEQVLKEESLSVNSINLCNLSTYNSIRRLVLNSDRLNELFSTKIICQKDFLPLIKSNSFLQSDKNSSSSIERVDKNLYGGGYGIRGEWRDLLNSLTYFKAYKRIDRQTLLELLSNMRKTGRVAQKDNIDFIFSKNEYKFEINPLLGSDFTKYEIIECLERILESGSYNPDSELGNNPSRTVKEIVTNYENGKSKVLRLLDNYSQNGIL